MLSTGPSNLRATPASVHAAVDRTAHALAELFFIADTEGGHQFDLVLIDTLCEDAIANGHQAQLLPALIAFLRDSEKLFDHTKSGTFDTTTLAQRLLLPLCEYALESFLSKRALKRGHEGKERKRKEENGDDERNKEMDEETVGAFLLLFREEGSTTSLISAFFASEGAFFLRHMLRPLLSYLHSVEWELTSVCSPPSEQERADDKVHHAAQLVLDFLWRARFDIPTTISTTVREVTRLADNKGFGTAGRQIAATLFFLRFVCPALVTVVVPAPLRRVLVQVSKLLQNSASNIRFGDKEKGMARFNGFIDANGERMQQLLDMLYKDVIEGDGASDTTDISGSLQWWKRMSTGKEAAMDKGYVDSLAALRDHLLHNQSFLPRYMKRLDYPQLKSFTVRLFALAATALASTPLDSLRDDLNVTAFMQRIILPKAHRHTDNSPFSSSPPSAHSDGGAHSDDDSHSLEELRFLADRHEPVISVPSHLSSLFFQGERYVFNYISELRRSPSAGTISIAEDRFLLLRGRSLSAEFVLIAESQFGLPSVAAANDLAFNLLYELGFCMSRNLCSIFRQRYQVEDPLVLYSIGSALFSFLGYASVEVLSGTYLHIFLLGPL